MPYSDYDPDDRDAPQDIDLADQDGDEPTIQCPDCGARLHEDAPRCPSCGQWIIGDTWAGQRATGWFWPVMVAVLVAVMLVMWHGLGR